MDVGTAIEKIKLQEQDNELKIKEKREVNATLVTLNRSLRDSTLHLENLNKEYERLKVTTDDLQQKLIIEKTKHRALVDQINDCTQQLEELRKATTDGISAVWEKRSKLIETNRLLSDKCDIWTLLIKSSYTDILPDSPILKDMEPQTQPDDRHKNAIERKKRALDERKRLLSEPETGEEFVRVKNALRYSREISAKFGQNKS